MAPHQQFGPFESRNVAPTQFQSLGVLFDRPGVPLFSDDAHRRKSDSKLSHDLFLPLDTRMEGQPEEMVPSKSWYPCVTRAVFTRKEPEDRLAMEFAAALNSDHEDRKASSNSRGNFGNAMVESPWVYGSDVDGDVWVPPSGARCISTKQDFLSSCNFCYRSLANHDIFMYRGDKAFCSHECRHQHIVIEERNSKVSRRFSMVPCMGGSSDFLSKQTTHASPVVQEIIAAK